MPVLTLSLAKKRKYNQQQQQQQVQRQEQQQQQQQMELEQEIAAATAALLGDENTYHLLDESPTSGSIYIYIYYENRTKVHNDMKEENKKYINGIQR